MACKYILKKRWTQRKREVGKYFSHFEKLQHLRATQLIWEWSQKPSASLEWQNIQMKTKTTNYAEGNHHKKKR